VSEPKHTTYQDVERELSSAEALLSQIRQWQRYLSMTTLLLGTFTVTGSVTAVGLATGKRGALPLMAGVVAITLAVLTVGFVVISHLRGRIATRSQTMIMSINWIREVFPLVAQREEWTVELGRVCWIM
jgi:hypothetical protein